MGSSPETRRRTRLTRTRRRAAATATSDPTMRWLVLTVGEALHTTLELGDPASQDGGSWVVFCHGLFGQMTSNFTAIGKALADQHRVLLVDLPDHGQSPWSRALRLPRRRGPGGGPCSSDDEPVALVGHSMGGKISMPVALRHPGLVERLVVVDVAPVPLRPCHRVRGLHRGRCRPSTSTGAERPVPGRGRAASAACPTPPARLPAPEPLPRRPLARRTRTRAAALAATRAPITDWP